MAKGDIVWFDQARQDVGAGVHDLANDDIRLGIITDAVTPTAATSDPRWGAGGGTNLSTSQVSTAGAEYTGPVLLTSQTWTGAVFDAENVSINVDATGPDDCRWGILYNDTDTGKRALGFVDFGAVVSLQDGPIAVNWNASGILAIEAAA